MRGVYEQNQESCQKMNILTDTLPDCIVSEGKSYPIKTDFRTWIKFTLLLENSAYDIIDIMTEAVILCFADKKRIPPDIVSAVCELVNFCVGDIEPCRNKNTVSAKRIYSFEHDSTMIYSAFRHDYGIDLSVDELHWYEFKALLAGLHKDNLFCEVMGYRSIDLKTIKDKEQRKFYRDMKRKFKLPDMRTDEQKNADMIEELSKVL